MDNQWKKLSFQECQYTKQCIQEIQSYSWANGLITKFNDITEINGEFPTSCMPLLFEIRFAYALSKLGCDIQNGYKCGTKNSEIKDSDVDFLVTEINGNRWFVELTSLDESKDVKTKTIVNGNTQSYIEKDLFKHCRRAQSRIFSKVAGDDFNNPEPTKFLEPKENEYNIIIIIIDMRGFSMGGIGLDVYDYREIVEGNKYPKNIVLLPEVNPLKGIFDSSHPDLRAKYLQKRIHGVGFIRESHYADGELQTILELFVNPKFFESDDELKAIFPLKKDTNYDPASNPYVYSTSL